MRALWHRWSRLGPWTRAFVQALLLMVVVHAVVLRWVIVQSTSMFATLVPGDLLLVQRWPVWTGVSRGDVLVFRDPAQDDRAVRRRQLLVKRVVGLPGDTVELRAGLVLVNGRPLPPWPGETRRHLVRIAPGTSLDSIAEAIGLPRAFVSAGERQLELPLNPVLEQRLVRVPGVRGAEPMSLSRRPARHLFPFSPFHPWSSDAYGPLRVPAAGDSVSLDPAQLPLYDRILTRHEGHVLEVGRDGLLLDGRPATKAVIAQDHYFVLGDSRHNSADSRHWGFVPADHLVGRATRVLLSWDAAQHRLRGQRWWRPLGR
ncbi:MAG: signal peptidase I [Flavobacteriales bacterium]|nr:Signal peptidase I [Flavobacteriales bacterium]MCC6575772.1 signal peptidase I [Flavobacteriales bacterium]NUQ15839.1 signal peptidase I [Flavobacteriales bacterium]